MRVNDFQQSERLLRLPTYIFSEINAMRVEAERRGNRILSLGIGDPDQPTPGSLVEKMKEAISKKENHTYSPYEGSLLFRTAVADWFLSRFKVKLDPHSEVLALIGSKEGIAHFPLAFCNPGDKCIFPSPGYPVFSTSISLAGGIPVPLPHLYHSSFLPDLNRVEELFSQHRPKYILLNYPSNPTSALCSLELLTQLVYLAKKFGVIVLYDNAYSEIYYDDIRPCSILEVPGGKDVAIELHSLSKTFNMTGWRIGFAVGNRDLLSGLLRVKTNIDSGPLLSVQEVAAYALGSGFDLAEGIRKVYSERRQVLLSGLKDIGIEYFPLKATFFAWARVPTHQKSMDFTKSLIKKKGLIVTPGVGFGPEGEGFFRMAMTVPIKDLLEAVERLGSYLKS